MESDIIFFSYSRTDGDFALKLAKDLRDAGAKIWLDQLDIKPGSHWDLSIESALKSAQNLIVILSPESVASNNVMDEVSFALESGKIVIPILLADCTPPFRLKRLQRVDFTGNYQTGLNKLLQYLEGISDTNVNKEVTPEKEKSKHAETGENPELKIKQSISEENNKDTELEKLIWEKAKKQDNLTAYIHYIDEYPNGKYKEEALSKLSILKEREKKNEPKIPIIQPTEKRHSKNYFFIGGGILIIAIMIVWWAIQANQNTGNLNSVEVAKLDSVATLNKIRASEAAAKDSIEDLRKREANDSIAIRLKKIVLGNKFEGGIIFYIDSTGQHGLIMAQSDETPKKMKWFDGTIVQAGAYDHGIYDGKKNTEKIVEKFGSGVYPAKLCNDSERENYTDWYLPSQEELDELYKFENHKTFTDDYYWSSTEIATADVYYRSFFNGRAYRSFGGNTAKVRAIRSF